MQFKVPKFIDIESKIIGNLTFKQAIYVGGGGGASFIVYKFIPIFIALPIIIIIGSFSLALAFYPKKKFGKPFIDITEAAFKYAIKSKLYTWKRVERKPTEDTGISNLVPTLSIPKISEGGLKNISKNIETGESSKF